MSQFDLPIDPGGLPSDPPGPVDPPGGGGTSPPGSDGLCVGAIDGYVRAVDGEVKAGPESNPCCCDSANDCIEFGKCSRLSGSFSYTTTSPVVIDQSWDFDTYLQFGGLTDNFTGARLLVFDNDPPTVVFTDGFNRVRAESPGFISRTDFLADDFPGQTATQPHLVLTEGSDWPLPVNGVGQSIVDVRYWWSMNPSASSAPISLVESWGGTRYVVIDLFSELQSDPIVFSGDFGCNFVSIGSMTWDGRSFGPSAGDITVSFDAQLEVRVDVGLPPSWIAGEPLIEWPLPPPTTCVPPEPQIAEGWCSLLAGAPFDQQPTPDPVPDGSTSVVSGWNSPNNAGGKIYGEPDGVSIGNLLVNANNQIENTTEWVCCGFDLVDAQGEPLSFDVGDLAGVEVEIVHKGESYTVAGQGTTFCEFSEVVLYKDAINLPVDNRVGSRGLLNVRAYEGVPDFGSQFFGGPNDLWGAGPVDYSSGRIFVGFYFRTNQPLPDPPQGSPGTSIQLDIDAVKLKIYPVGAAPLTFNGSPQSGVPSDLIQNTFNRCRGCGDPGIEGLI